MNATKSKNFRVSLNAIRLLEQAAKRNHSTETAVLEMCVARYAIECGVDVDAAQAVLTAHIAKSIGARASSSPQSRGADSSHKLIEDTLGKYETASVEAPVKQPARRVTRPASR